MTGDLIARGRDCDVFEAGPGLVLRRNRTGASTELEALTMRHLAEHGYPVPAVHDAHGCDIVMQRLDGPTMLDTISRQPWTMRANAVLLADLIGQLGHVVLPAHEIRTAVSRGNTLSHLDLHPGNVVLTADGPVVIDWTNASIGTVGLDAANTWLTLAAGEPDGGALMRFFVAAGRKFFVGRFVAAIDRSAAQEQLATAFSLRLRDPNLRDGERATMQALVDRVT